MARIGTLMGFLPGTPDPNKYTDVPDIQLDPEAMQRLPQMGNGKYLQDLQSIFQSAGGSAQPQPGVDKARIQNRINFLQRVRPNDPSLASLRKSLGNNLDANQANKPSGVKKPTQIPWQDPGFGGSPVAISGAPNGMQNNGPITKPAPLPSGNWQDMMQRELEKISIPSGAGGNQKQRVASPRPGVKPNLWKNK